MVYLAELLVVVTDRLKMVRIRARNVPRTRTHARMSLDQESDDVACSMRRGAVLLGGKLYIIECSISHFAIYLPKFNKIRGNLTKL